jgi:hypothetical protein
VVEGLEVLDAIWRRASRCNGRDRPIEDIRMFMRPAAMSLHWNASPALEAELKAATARTADEVERFRVAMLGRNGAVTELFDAFKQVAGRRETRS